jgi:hypothetical protein
MQTFKLTAKQVEANRLLGGKATNVMLRGGSRSGKTFLIMRAICIRAMRVAGSRHAVFRFRFNHAKASIWQDTLPKVMRLCFPDVPYDTNETDLIATFPNGSQIYLAGLDDKARVEKILGLEFATLYFNESSQIPWTSVELAMSRLAQNTDLTLRAFFDCNPPSKLHWSYDLFKRKVKPGTKEALTHPDDYAEMKVNPSDNADNLPAKYFEILGNMTESQRLRFEKGEWASEVAGALWTVEQLDLCRVKPSQLPQMRRIVVAVDPSGTKGDGKGDDIGIVVAGLGVDGKGYVLEDATCQLGPEGWSRRAVDMYHRHRADRIVAERNYGGAMVEAMIRVADPNVPFTEVTATRGKVVRAEPVSALYELGKAFHAGSFPELEDQMCAMTPAGYVGERSPDRADALVWAFTELLVDGSNYTLAGW